MSNLDPEMRRLAIRASVHFDVRNPERYLHPDDDAFDSIELLVHVGNDALQRGAVEEGLRLICWSPFILAAVIGYDGYIVSSFGETLASALKTLTTTPNDRDIALVGEKLGIDDPEKYLIGRSPLAKTTGLWSQALLHAARGPRPFGLRLAFHATYVRAIEFTDAAPGFAEPAARAAANFKAFANGRD